MLRVDFQKIKGFTLIEVLVSTIILAIGLLGLASLQTLALKDNQDAFFFAQAASLAYEMSDRIKANTPTTSPPWQSATIPTPLGAGSCTSTHACNTLSGCTPTVMAQYDYCAWKANVISRIGTTATAVVEASPVTGGVCTGPATRRCITIGWNRNKSLGTSATNTFQLEITP
ncbi:MAG: type IV pilus modification protein PilV [Methylococcaceae bacterium]|nr:type IV pilus modification protein PilV [Methylococcaceae bacterium]